MHRYAWPGQLPACGQSAGVSGKTLRISWYARSTSLTLMTSEVHGAGQHDGAGRQSASAAQLRSGSHVTAAGAASTGGAGVAVGSGFFEHAASDSKRANASGARMRRAY